MHSRGTVWFGTCTYIEPTPTTSQNRAAFMMNILYHFGSDFNGRVGFKIRKSSIAPLNSIDRAVNAVELFERLDNFSDNIIQAGT